MLELNQIHIKGLKPSLGELGWITSCRQIGQSVNVELSCDFPMALMQDITRKTIEQFFAHMKESVTINIQQQIKSHLQKSNKTYVKQVKNIIAISACKGGVGKSTHAYLLAKMLFRMGARVGLLDADIYGPSIPTLIGIQQKPESFQGKFLKPVDAQGIQMMSIGLLIEKETAMIWRGPMVSKALMQLAYETLWDDLDYLIVDLPPGTGDIHLTIAKQIPMTGAIVVTTPQLLATEDVLKGMQMFRKMDIPILGLVENMAGFECDDCHKISTIFGQPHGEILAQEQNIPYLSAIPTSGLFTQKLKKGLLPPWEAQQNWDARYQSMTYRLLEEIHKQTINLDWKLPKLVVFNAT